MALCDLKDYTSFYGKFRCDVLDITFLKKELLLKFQIQNSCIIQNFTVIIYFILLCDIIVGAEEILIKINQHFQ